MRCILKPLESKYPDIELGDGQVVCVGRGPTTKVKDARCSRNQLELRSNYKSQKVSVRQVGPNESALNGTPIGMGIDREAKSNDTLDILFGQYRYKIVFEGFLPSQLMEDSKPAKIPRMFQNRDQFKKDNSAAKRGEWTSKGDQLHIYQFGENPRRAKANVAGFDMDGTIITTKSGRVFPKDEKDWKFAYNSTVAKLQTFFEQNDNYRFVIITNQAGVGSGKTSLSGMKNKIESIVVQLDIPLIVFIVPGKGAYRKPMTGIWPILVQEFNEGVDPDLKESFYCGDAAGRKRDHSIGDRLFAMNVGLTFKTPEEFFMGQKPQEFNLPLFNPKKLLENPPTNDHIQYPDSDKTEVIIMIGYPGSGKSSFVKSYVIPKGYVYVNRDTLKTAAKCISTAQEALGSGKSVVVDNTNPERKDRAEYVKLAKKYGVPARCFHMNVSHNQALHNNRFRELNKDGHVAVPAVAFNTFKSRLQDPTMDEGYSEIVLVNFVPAFVDTAKRDLYGKYLLEK